MDAGQACIAYDAGHVRGVAAQRIQVDEIWQYCSAEELNVETTVPAWTWTVLNADFKLIVSRLLGLRDGATARVPAKLFA